MTDVQDLRLEADEIQKTIDRLVQELEGLTAKGIVDINEVSLVTEQLEVNADKHAKLTSQIRELE